MANNNFSRSNVNEQTLQVGMPETSGFNMSHTTQVSPRMGIIHPINYEPLLPRDVVSGSIKADLTLEKIMTPSIGRVRADLHTFVVHQNRINRDWKFFVEGKTGYDTKPNFQPYAVITNVLAYLLNVSATITDINSALFDGYSFTYSGTDYADPTIP